jgi:hypothetical protein
MRLAELVQRVKELGIDSPADWVQLRAQIFREHMRATTTEERVALLKAWHASMNLLQVLLDRTASAEEADRFNAAWLADYRELLVQETLVGANICASLLDEVTRREVAAGRLASDDALRQVAERTVAAPHYSRTELVSPGVAIPRERIELPLSDWQLTLNEVVGRLRPGR